MKEVLAQLQTRVAEVAPSRPASQSSPQTGDQNPGQPGGQSAGFEQDTSTSSGAAAAGDPGGFQQDTGAGPVAGGYVDSCCGPLIQQFETTVNAFVADVPSFSRRFRNLNLIFQGLRLLNDIVNQADILKES